jgi:hypothetical protein
VLFFLALNGDCAIDRKLLISVIRPINPRSRGYDDAAPVLLFRSLDREHLYPG